MFSRAHVASACSAAVVIATVCALVVLLNAAPAQLGAAKAPAANETGVVDVLRDMHPDSILLGVLLAARLVSACDRIVQLTPLHGSELSANVLVCIVLAEKLLNDAPFTDLIAMIAAATAVLRIAPHYIDYRIVQSIADRLPADAVHSRMSRNEIREHFQKQFRIENFNRPVREVIEIERDRDGTQINIGYEVREHLFYNIDVVLVFGEQRVFE